MKIMIVIVNILFAGTWALADSQSAMFCTGKNISLVSETNYMGENSSANQQLFRLEKNDTGATNLTLRAFFLDVEIDLGFHTVVYTGKNEVGGTFQMTVSSWKDVGDGDIVYEEAKGKITYSQGPLAATDEEITCFRK